MSNETESENENKNVQEQYVAGENILYSSGQVAEILGIKPDSVRYYAYLYKEFLSFQKTKDDKGGHNRFRDEDIETLKVIMSLVEKNYKPAEIRAQLRDPNVRIIMASAEQQSDSEAAKIILANNNYLMSQFNIALQGCLQSVIKQQHEAYMEQMEELKEEIAEIKAQNTELLRKLESSNERLASMEEKKQKGIFSIFRK